MFQFFTAIIISLGFLLGNPSPAKAAACSDFCRGDFDCSSGYYCKTSNVRCPTCQKKSCTVTSCSASCPTACGQPAQTVYGTTNCNTRCSKNCPATTACCDNSCPTGCGSKVGYNGCGNWCGATPACPPACSVTYTTNVPEYGCGQGGCPVTNRLKSPTNSPSNCSPKTTANSCRYDDSCAAIGCNNSCKTEGECTYIDLNGKLQKGSSTDNNLLICCLKDTQIAGVCNKVRSSQYSETCITNSACTTGLCHPIVKHDVLCGTVGAYDNCLNQWVDCSICLGRKRKSGYDYGTLCPPGTITGTCSGLYAGATCIPIAPPPTPTPTPSPRRTPPPTLPPRPAASWWQVCGSAIAGTDIRSMLPNGQKLVSCADGGVVAFGGSVNTNSQPSGSTADINYSVSQAFTARNSYAVFKRRVTNKVTPNPLAGNILTPGIPASDGYIYWQATGTVTLPAQNIGTDKVVLLSDGAVNITGNLTFTDGQGLLVILAGGNITLDGSVSTLKGIYLAQGTFNTGASANQLQVDGTVVGLTDVVLSRTYTTGSQPAEIFIYRPEYVDMLPPALLRRKILMQEIAP